MSVISVDTPIVALRERLDRGEPISEELPWGGQLYLDRPLPFLFVYRQPADREDAVTEQLVTSQAAYLIAPPDAAEEAAVRACIEAIAEAQAAAFGRFLVVELWTRAEVGEGTRRDPASLKPQFRLVAPENEALAPTVDRLTRALQGITLHKEAADVTVSHRAAPAPPDHTPLLDGSTLSAFTLGLEVAPVYRQVGTGTVFPFLFDTLRRQLSDALKQAAHQFACSQTSLRPPHYLALGTAHPSDVVTRVDRELAGIDESFAFLLQITPVNAADALATFEACGFEEAPVFRYRPLPVDPGLIKRRLFNIPIEHVDDPGLAWLFREKQEELDRKITMLRDRDTRPFFFGSLQLYGEVQPALRRLANQILSRLPAHDYDLGSSEHMEGDAFAEVAAIEFEHYRQSLSDFPRTVQLRSDMPPGLMVSQGRLLIGHGTKVPAPRVEALLQHEVGTHMVTYFNGRAQPLRLLYTGLAGYEALQEGLAVLAEYLVGGLNVPRLRVLAARVLAADALIDGASFVDVFRLLRRAHAFEVHEAFSIAMRTFRGGGLIKDVIYLRGLHELMHDLQDGGALEPLFVGKIALHHRPLLQELEQRGILKPVPLRPRFLDHPQAADRLARIRAGLTFVDLVDRKQP